MYAVSTLLFLVARKASRVHKLTYYFSSIVEQHDLKCPVVEQTVPVTDGNSEQNSPK